MKFLLAIATVITLLPLAIHAQDGADEPTKQELPITHLKPEITTRSIFPDKLAYALVYFPTTIEQPLLDLDYEPIENDTTRILSIETYEIDQTNTKESTPETAKSAAIIQFQVRKPGIATLPPIPFTSEDQTKRYQTTPTQLIASELTRSDELHLTITPTKTKIYAGEPTLFNLTWTSTIHAPALQNLRLNPSFFNDPNIEIAIPRNTQPEDNQVGLPIGGRRSIATRTLNPDNPKSLGTITLPIYLRFNQPGTIQLQPTKLEISKLSSPKDGFAQYVAHFDNSFFTPTEQDQSYARLYTTSEAHTITVLPLPTNKQSQNFSGIFTPTEITTNIKPTNTVEIGQLLELQINLKTNTPTALLTLPPLTNQPNLDERFLITGDYAKTWHPHSTTFTQRLRILNTTIQNIPPLNYTIFNTTTGNYQTITTPPIPLTVNPYQEQTTIPLKNLNATQTLTTNPQGIWHNHQHSTMTNIIQQLLHTINTHFWLILTLITTLTAILIPLILKSRKRALNPTYKLQQQTLKAFQKAPSNSPQKWTTFLSWLASHHHTNNQAWTLSDTTQALKEINANQQDLTTLTKLHQQQDQSTYTKNNQTPNYSSLTEIAKRLTKNLPLILLTTLLTLSPQTTTAADAKASAELWETAQTTFQQAQEKNSPQLYSQAALLYQTAAQQNIQPATSYYNAGNAWFQAGELGHSIAAYRHAQQLTPWDKNITKNLTSARSLVATEVPLTQTTWQKIPLITLKTTTLATLIILAIFTLLHLRHRTKPLQKATLTTTIIFLTLLTTTTIKLAQQKPTGIITTNQVNSKKGPSYAYANAFDLPLKDGLEFHLLETRQNWHHIQLPDHRQAWVPTTQATLIE
ncbi:MAG: tetratricopeptide repeat protein [Akkermansiaceae bacterium]